LYAAIWGAELASGTGLERIYLVEPTRAIKHSGITPTCINIMNLPPYHTFPTIVSDTIVLRAVQTSDLQDLMEISFYDARPALTVEDAAEMQGKINLDYQQGTSIHWCIVDQQTHKIVGTLGYYRGLDQGAGELGCVLKPAFRGQGFMTFAMKLAIEFGIKEIGLSTIKAITSTENHGAIKLLERLGFVKTAEISFDEIEYQFVGEL